LWFEALFGIKVVSLNPLKLKLAQIIMANVEKLQEHLKKAKSNLTESAKKGDDAVAVRKLKKKTKRLARKSSKITATEKMAELKKKKKKDRKEGSSES
jgi:hypothetical protein